MKTVSVSEIKYVFLTKNKISQTRLYYQGL